MVTIPRTVAQEVDSQEGKLELLVVEGDSVTVHDLPDRGSLLVGRGPDVDVQLADPSSSGRHAKLEVENGRVAVEDLASRNGTQVRGQRIAAGQTTELAAGEAALLGNAVLLIQRRRARPPRRRVWRHEYFEARLAEECDLSQGGGATFSVARLDFERNVPIETFIQAADQILRPSDIVGSYGPGAFEVLLRRTTPQAAERALEPFLSHGGLHTAMPRFALAHFPVDGQTADTLIAKACARIRPASRAAKPGVIVLDPHMREIYRLAEKAAGGIINVLITGETGAGKEILAESIHRASRRADRPFLCLNCAALTDNLLESELFGHERGAFTDAKVAKPGLLETASGGTVFLDEIGEMSPTLQAKLLRVIETKQVTRVGGLRPIAIDVRFVSATHRDLVQEIRDKRFRSDLYYRLNGLGLEIPPLRARRAEIRPLADAFLELLAAQSGLVPIPRLGDDTAALLELYSWPGNIRELRNVIERALLLSDGGEITPDHLPLEILSGLTSAVGFSPLTEPAPAPDDRWSPEENADRARILDALAAEGGNQTRAAQRLGISRGTMVARLERFQISRPQKRM